MMILGDTSIPLPLLYLSETILSIGQRCNEDVLEEIFLHLQCSALAKAARVCQAWLPAASRTLYHNIHISTYSLVTDRLAQTLRTAPSLRGLVRHVALYHPKLDEADPSVLDWLALLPEHSLLSITLENTDMFNLLKEQRMLDLPAFRTVSSIVAHGRYLSGDISTLLNIPYLQSLSIELLSRRSYSFVKPLRPTLRRLAITICGYNTVIETILQSFEEPLEQFMLVVSSNLCKAGLSSLQTGLRRHAPCLKRLFLIGHPQDKLPSMDDYILSFPTLETLLCSYSTFSPLLVKRLPPTLTSLILRVRTDCTFPSDEYAAALQRHRHKLRRLSALTIVDVPGRWRRRKNQWEPLVELCAAEGISFRIMRRDPYNPFVS